MTGVDARGPGRPRGLHARPLPSPADGGSSDDNAVGDGAGSGQHGPAGGSAVARWLVPVIPAVLALFTGGYRVGVPPLWRDEAATKAIAGRSVGQIVATMPHDDVVHFAYYLVVHVVIRVLGNSNADLRLPSVLAMAVAAAFTALIAQRLARLSRTPAAGRWYAAATGLLAGVVFAVLPSVIRYAQEARSYAIVTMLAAIATYLLLRALDDGRGGGTGIWWAAYGAAVFLTGLFNIFALLILAAHGLTLLAAGRLGTARPARRRLAGVPLGWLIAGVIAAVLLVPLGLMAYAQRDALSWMSATPIVKNIVALTHFWPGTPGLAWPVFGLAAVGVAASLIAERRALSTATVALPWLVAPPAILLAASLSHPVYDQRYVEFCLPALAICVAAGITWLWRAIVSAVPRLARPAGLGWLAAVPALAAAVALIVALQPGDALVREPGYRPDNLEHESAIIAANARPGDIVFYIPLNDRIVSMPFPGPWRELRDIALGVSPVASNTLYGTDVSPAVLLSRFTHVTRVWVVSSSEVPMASYLASAQATAVDQEEARLIGAMRQVHRWRDGDTELTLYATR
jgi:mannosyltransferase